MRVFTADHHEVPLPRGHRFPMGKYRALRERLLAEGLVRPGAIERSPLVTIDALRLVHDPGYLADLFAGTLEPAAVTRIGFPWSWELVVRSRASTGGTIAAARAALQDGVAGNLAGGTHHAHHDHGAGYCVFNDIAVAARLLLEEGRVTRMAVLDVDVHQGDGTAALLADEPRAFTCSLHGERNFPLRKRVSDLDVELPDGCEDPRYLDALGTALDACLARPLPDLLVVQGGVDALAADRLGRLALTHAGLLERDRRILGRAAALGVPVALTLGGGYGEPIDATIEAHANTYRAAREAFGT